MTNQELYVLDYIDFNNLEQVEACDKLFQYLLTKEIYDAREIQFLNTYLTSKLGNQAKLNIQIINLTFREYLRKYEDNNLFYCLKKINEYYEVRATNKKIEEDFNLFFQYLHTFYTESYVNCNNRSYALLVIYHEFKHSLQQQLQKNDSKTITLDQYLLYYEQLIMKFDYEFYVCNHKAFYMEQDAEIFSIYQTMKLLEQSNHQLSLLDKSVLNYHLEGICKRNFLQDRNFIFQKVKNIVFENKDRFSIWKIFLLEFDHKFQRKTIDQIFDTISIDEKTKIKTYYNYTIDNDLFDYLIFNSIYWDKNYMKHFQRISLKEQELVRKSIVNARMNMTKYQFILEKKMNRYHYSFEDYVKVIKDQDLFKNYLRAMKKMLEVSYKKNKQKNLNDVKL